MAKKKKNNQDLTTIMSKELIDGIYVQVKSGYDAKSGISTRILQFTTLDDFNFELFLGCVHQYLDTEAPSLLEVPTDFFDCH